MLDVKWFLNSPLHAIHRLVKISINNLRLLKHKISRFLQFWRELNTREIKPVPFFFCVIITVISSMLHFLRFLIISFCFPWCFRIFPLVFLRFPWLFLWFSLSASPFSYFRFYHQNDANGVISKLGGFETAD